MVVNYRARKDVKERVICLTGTGSGLTRPFGVRGMCPLNRQISGQRASSGILCLFGGKHSIRALLMAQGRQWITLAARREGIQHARNATAVRNSGTTVKVTKSCGRTPYRTLAENFATAHAAARPSATAIDASSMPWPMIRRWTAPTGDPSARRMPISRVRRLIE